MYYKVENYVDDDGKTIVCKTAVEKIDAEWNLAQAQKRIFSGVIHVTARTPQGIAQVPFEFEFPEQMPLNECFEKFEEVAKAKFEEFKKEQEDRNRIIPASSMPTNPGGIIQFPK